MQCDKLIVCALEALQLTDGVYMVTGLGGNVGGLRTQEAAAVVDIMTFRRQEQRLQSQAERLR
ncbi:MAG: hypothetical protein ETSY1_43075 [Candidatus Entotheonella factor]|uniref:Uncharacterized protein n=1 Tax=Entotheonella factor TaxID=1429438 RepID=W4L5F3_ENTF1|nr:MAG: hypothetical protein ETSY1_43075 [Candidatus Entotheonella factor]